MSKLDIRKYKTKLREKYKKIRSIMTADEKKEKDKLILKKFLSLSEYKNACMIITYVSTRIEVNTINLINKSIADGKKVVVPRCIKDTRYMDFWEINSIDQLDKGTFGVLEPDINICKKIEDFSGSICVVPGLAFDGNGYRLGYGKGYYDRFLSGYTEKKVGLCYSSCIKYSLHKGKFDVPVNTIITENYIKTINKGNNYFRKR